MEYVFENNGKASLLNVQSKSVNISSGLQVQPHYSNLSISCTKFALLLERGSHVVLLRSSVSFPKSSVNSNFTLN